MIIHMHHNEGASCCVTIQLYGPTQSLPSSEVEGCGRGICGAGVG